MAKDVITRFKLETTAYDSKLRDAAKGLADYTKTATAAGKEFGKFTQSNVEAARALGNITPSANNAKDKVKELVGAFNEASKAYNQLTKEQQQSDFGKAMSESLSKLKVQIAETKKELYGLGDSTKGVGSGLFSGDKMSGMLQVFGGNVMTKLAGVGVGFVSEIKDMVAQGAELAKQGEGIRIAFERLGRGDLLDGLREATHGTVTDLELMKAAVKFNDFKLPVEELGTMLAFAQQKAKDTGQSVDYMVDSIVTGLGRKSLMILDNLGLSASEIKEKMAETGDMTKAVGEIIREQMSKAGDYVETAADRAAQANVSLQNKMEELGRKFAPLEEASNNFWTSMKIGILDVVGGPLATLLNKLTEAGRLMNAYGQMGGSGKVGRMTSNLAGAREGNRQSIYQQQQERFWRYINPREQQIKDIRAWQKGERGEALQKRIGAITEKYGSLDATKIQAEVDAAKKMLSDYQHAAKQYLNPVKADVDTKGAEQSVESLKVKLIELQAQRKKAIAAGDTDLSKNLAKQISQVKADIKGLGGSTTGKGSSNTKKEQTEMQQNQKRINDLTQKYVDLMSEASKESKPLTNEQRDRAASIKKEIRDLERRNGQLKLYQEQAKGKFLGSGAFKQQLEVDVAVNNKKIEELEKQLINLEGITIDPKTVTITATDEALPKLREIQGITIDDKTTTVTADTQEALQALQGIEGVTIDPKTVTITATDDALPKLREIQGVTIDEKTVAITADDKTQPEFREVEGIRLKGKKVTVTADTMDALRAVQGINGITIDPKTVTITATDEALPKLREIQGITIDEKTVAITADDKTQPEFREVEGIRLKGKKVTVTADTMEALRAVQGINGITIDPKTVTITATDEALPKLREIEGITIDDKTMTVTAETADALRALQGINGITIDPKTVTIKATDEALPKLREIQGITIDEKTVAITADDKTQPEFREVEGIRLKGKKVTVTADTMEALRAVQGINGITIDPKTVTITATDEALPKLREIQGITIDDKTMNVTAETADALRALQGINGITIDPKTVTITATDEALPKLREIEGITIDDKTMTVTAETADALRALQGINGITIDPKTVTITATDEALPKLREIQGVTIDEKTVAITADDKTQPEFREVEGIRLKGKKVAITADDKTQPEFREVEGIKLKGKKVTVTADTQEALQALQGIEGVTVDTKTVKVTAETDEARQKVEELKRQIAELKDQNIMITAAMGSIGMPLSETSRMGVTDVTYGKGKNQFVPAPLMPTMDEVVRQRGGNLLDEKAMKAVNDDLYGDKRDKSDKNTTKSLLNGISQLTDGLEKIGIDVPDEIQAVIGVIQGVMQVIEAVNAIIGVTQTTALAANTAAMISLESALWANTFLGFSNGGIVPKFADGGLVGRAALGIAIPGNSLSGDNLRLPVDGGRGVIGVNSGEVILNRAQQGVIASALDGGGAQSMQLSATIRGEDIRLAINNNGRRTGRGEYVQSTRRR